MLRIWGKTFINLIYPLSCLVCKVRLTPLSDKPLCQECWEKIEFNLPPFCRICGKHLPARTQNLVFICQGCQTSANFFRKAYSVCVYEGIIKECIHLLKYRGKLSLVRPLTKLMTDFAHNFLDMQDVDSILPVPLHANKLRQRQFNQAYLFGELLAKRFSKKIQHKLLRKIKVGPAQVNLSRAERLKNVKGTFKVKDSSHLKDRNILLIDDVLTTGATANECSKVLREAGANRVDVFTLARSV